MTMHEGAKQNNTRRQPSARQTAVDLLLAIDKRGLLSSDAVNNLTREGALSSEDRRLAVRLIYGVLEQKLLLDYLLQQVSRTKLSKIDPFIHMVLRTAIYQMMFMDRIPASAVVNEAVKLSKKKGQHLSSFVNGVLRNFQRGMGSFDEPVRSENPNGFLSIMYSHPKWLVDRWVSLFGYDFTEALMAANNAEPPLSVRVNRLKASTAEVQKRLEQDGIISEVSSIFDYALIIHSGQDRAIQTWPAFIGGELYVQDLASMMVTEILDPQPGERILDLCAAPGSKTTHMAEKMNNRGEITARDVSDKKLQRIKENSNRLGISIIKPQIWDGLDFDPQSVDAYDRVLLDAPCTGLGIIRRKPEIRYRRQPEDISSLVTLQSQLLENASHYVKKGGIMVYSTCSIDPEENQGVIQNFLSAHPQFKLVGTPWSDEDGSVRLYPNVQRTDGFFIAKMVRV
ncbi:16S rRNA (cytosine(967)-C(5))-methyltransferase RsmB [Acidaminobacter hydrogenoformans]|uniref:16S rRNA (cytosine(967)-C(5))-methyltransferase n=1 Tax=Acidaminobacter hydrogenoformans DSM 2784 TaxID=1120920 RepID=A0A1G5RT84_9FIRM|nr:16S rRNA (cytosine(967)-C(5))-methyltransferase RsmB [Acidaminobacter hydrogenoformans]SCZ76960.1 16S rRNA (cytosine967-C5)-methyltransferase [Acidaminobacter hydrogenoformans DSM 2784]